MRREPYVVSIRVVVHRGGTDGYGSDLPLERDGADDYELDLTALKEPWAHPMLAVRIRVFIDWHRDAGHAVTVRLPRDPATAQRLIALETFRGLPNTVVALPLHSPADPELLAVRRFRTHHDVEDLAAASVELLQRQSGVFGEWSDSVYMAVGELCDNALQHGRNGLGAYVAADRRVVGRRQFRLAIADLGIGVPEHIRHRYPEWHDDAAAIGQALVRGVSGTGDPHRGNGFAEVLDLPFETVLVRSGSAADLDIRSGKGRVGVELFGATPAIKERPTDQPRRGTWLTYTITTAEEPE